MAKVKARVISVDNIKISDGRTCRAPGLELEQIVEVEVIEPGHAKYNIYKGETKPGEILFCFDNDTYILDKHIEMISMILEEGEEL